MQKINPTSTGTLSQAASFAGTQNLSGSSPAKVAGEINGLLSYYDSDELKKINKTDKEYNKFLSEFESIGGYFNFYFRKEDNKTLLEIKPEQLNKFFLCSTYRVTGSSEFGMDSDTMGQNNLVYFKRVGNNIQFFAKNLSARSTNESLNKAIERSDSDTLLGIAEIKALNSGNGSMAIELQDLLFKDADNLLYNISMSDAKDKKEQKIELDKKNSYFDKPKSFPKNSEIKTTLIYNSKNKSDDNLQISYNFSFSELPKEQYAPRKADDRIGYFETVFKNCDNVTADKRETRYIERWNLGKIGADGRPEKPIVYWVANTVPAEYREAVKQGILAWNKSFEKIGIKDAIKVEMQPDNADWDPSDVRYNTVNFIYTKPVYAMGPSHVNPLTGEIYSTDILANFEFINTVRKDIILFDEHLKTIKGEKEREAYISKKLMTHLTCLIFHEVGHTLGLRHNFAGSTYEKDGVTASIMDYLPRRFEQEKEFAQTSPGAYDDLAIKYGYGGYNLKTTEDEKKHTESAAKERISKNIPYATDQHVELDPYASQNDEGDPLEFCKKSAAMGKKLWERMETDFEKPGMSFTELSEIFSYGLGKFRSAADLASKYIGGIRYNNIYVGDIKDKNSEEPVESQEQRKALKFLTDEIFSAASFNLPQKFLNKLTFDADFSGRRKEITDSILNVPLNVLNKLFSKEVLTRVFHNEKKYEKDPFKMEELFATITNSVFSEVIDSKNTDINIPYFRQEIQKAYFKKLVKLSQSEDMPVGVKTHANSALQKIKDHLKYALEKSKHKDIKISPETTEFFNALLEMMPKKPDKPD